MLKHLFLKVAKEEFKAAAANYFSLLLCFAAVCDLIKTLLSQKQPFFKAALSDKDIVCYAANQKAEFSSNRRSRMLQQGAPELLRKLNSAEHCGHMPAALSQ